MNLRLILPAAAAVLLAASCTPYVEPPPEAPADPSGRKQPTPEEQEKIRRQREEQKKKDEANQTPDRDTKPEGETGAITEQPKNEGSGGDSGGGSAPEKPAAPVKDIPVARPVPGKPGMVFSPFNNKVIDVKGIPSGRLVADPTYPASEKKHFRVP